MEIELQTVGFRLAHGQTLVLHDGVLWERQGQQSLGGALPWKRSCD